MAKTQQVAAEVCLYGTREIGAGWLARTADGTLFGDGEPRQGHTFTDALWIACKAMREAGVQGRTVRVFSPDGLRMADTIIDRPAYYGDLKWRPATVIVVSAEEIERAAAA